MYLDYETYKKLGGELSEIDFTRFNLQATNKINSYTQNKITESIATEYAGVLEYCSYDLIDLFAKKYDTVQSGVASESNQGMSKTYTQVTDTEITSMIDDVLENYLTAIPTLTYLGVKYWS